MSNAVVLHITKSHKAGLRDGVRYSHPMSALGGIRVSKFIIDADCLINPQNRDWFCNVAMMRAYPHDQQD